MAVNHKRWRCSTVDDDDDDESDDEDEDDNDEDTTQSKRARATRFPPAIRLPHILHYIILYNLHILPTYRLTRARAHREKCGRLLVRTDSLWPVNSYNNKHTPARALFLLSGACYGKQTEEHTQLSSDVGQADEWVVLVA